VRIRNREYTKKDSILNLGDFGIDHIINPEPTIVRALAGMIEIPGTCDYATLADGQVLMLGLDISSDSPAAGKTLAELGEVGDMDAFLFLYIKRGDTVVIPKGQDRIEPGDNVHVLVSADTVKFLLPIVHRRPCKINEVIIAGASRIGQQLAATIEEKVEKVYLIEPDSVLAEQAAENLTKTTVLQGDPTDLGVLEEAALAQCDLFCAASDNDQRNILSALLAKKHTKTLVAVVVHQPDYVSVLDSLGVEIVVSPHLVTVGEILMHVRRGRVHAVTRLAESEAEILEMEVQPNSPIIKSKLKDIKFPGDALVGARIHHSIIQIPNGDTEFYPGDTVLVFALPSAISRVEKLFTRRS
jgi:trk system potassium uptake protein TrkA